MVLIGAYVPFTGALKREPRAFLRSLGGEASRPCEPAGRDEVAQRIGEASATELHSPQ